MTTTNRVGVAGYQYEAMEGWGNLPGTYIISDVATDSKDRVYVAVRDVPYPDITTGAILVFDRDGNLLTSWGEDLFTVPHGIWISDEDEIYFADCNDHTVRKYSTSGELLMTIGVKGQPGAPGAPFHRPCRAVLSSSGDIYVADGYGQDRVHRLSPEGDVICSWGETGEGPGQFQLPHDVTVDRNDRVYVMDRTNNRCQVFDSNGTYITEWEDIRGANDAVIDDDDVMHIAEGLAGMLLVNLDGTVIGRWGGRGDQPLQSVGALHGLWIDRHGDLYTAAVGAENRLLKYARV